MNQNSVEDIYSKGMQCLEEYRRTQKKGYANEALTFFQRAAEKNHAEAMNILGMMYHDGFVVKKDYKIAAKWFAKAAEFNCAGAVNDLGIMYFLGEGVPKNLSKAEELLLKAKKLGSPTADLGLRMVQEAKKTNNRNTTGTFALKDLQKQAARGDVEAMHTLGTLYFIGEFGKIDKKQGIKWLEKAIHAGFPISMQFLGLCYLNDDELKRKASKSNREAKKLFLKMIKYNTQEFIDSLDKPTKEKYGQNMYDIGMAYFHGHGIVEQNYEMSRQILSEAVKIGSIPALTNLGIMYVDGLGVDVDYTKAINYYRKAVEHGEPNAIYNLGTLYYQGNGCEKDITKAIDLFKKAVEFDNPDAAFNLAIIYAKGIESNGKVVLPVDEVEANKWIKKAAELGDSEATSYLRNDSNKKTDSNDMDDDEIYALLSKIV